MSASIGLYFKNNTVIVIPQGGGGGYSYDIGPVATVEPEVAAVAAAIDAALETSAAARRVPTQPPYNPRESPVLKQLKLRSYKALYHSAAYVTLFVNGPHLSLLTFEPAPDGRGFQLTDAPEIVIADRAQTAAIVLRELQAAKRMP